MLGLEGRQGEVAHGVAAGNLLVVEFFRKMSGVNRSPLIWGIKGSKNGNVFRGISRE